MGYGHKYNGFPSPTRIKKLKRLAESTLAPSYSPELALEAERLVDALEEATECINRIAEQLRKSGVTASWDTVDYHYRHLKSLDPSL